VKYAVKMWQIEEEGVLKILKSFKVMQV